MEAFKKFQKFLKDVRSELRKVSWPNRSTVVVNTTAVIVVSIICGIYIGIVDVIFKKLLQVVF